VIITDLSKVVGRRQWGFVKKKEKNGGWLADEELPKPKAEWMIEE